MRNFEDYWKNIELNFDFQKVKKIMHHLNWRWHHEKEPPTLTKIIESAKEICESAYRQYSEGGSGSWTYSSSGGFMALYTGEWMELTFVVTSWDTDGE